MESYILHDMVSEPRGYEGTVKLRVDLEEAEEQTKPVELYKVGN